MKVFLACLFCSVSMLYAADSYAQRVRVELGSSRMSVGEVLREIESQSDFDLATSSRCSTRYSAART